MYQFLRACLSGFALLCSLGAAAQLTFDVQLGTLSEFNVTLDDSCRSTVVPEQVLTGDLTGLPLDAFTIVVEDDDEANGPQIDNCGSLTVRITADTNIIKGFTVGWSTVVAEDKTAPEISVLPAAPTVPLFCAAFDTISLSTLAPGTDRCYQVTVATGEVVTGTLSTGLGDRLRAGGGLPIVYDNCAERVEVCVNDVVTRDETELAGCGPVRIERVFTITEVSTCSGDGYRNDPARASYFIDFFRPGILDARATVTEVVDTVRCDDPRLAGQPFGTVPAPTAEESPFELVVDGVTIPLRLSPDERFCNYGISVDDGAVVEKCAGTGYAVLRNYNLIDWCAPGEVLAASRTIKVGDFDAPVFTGPSQTDDFGNPGPFVVPTNAGNQCGAFIRLDRRGLALEDRCSSDRALTLTAQIFPNGDLSANPLGSYRVDLNTPTPEMSDFVPVGTHVLRYTFADPCGNQDFADFDFTVVDRTGPAAICENGLNISLTGAPNGITVLRPSDIDNGSRDDCSDVDLLIARLGSGDMPLDVNGDSRQNTADYTEQIFLTCADLGTARVSLLTTDAAGNSNTCWLEVLIEDKTAPRCAAPNDVTFDCTDFNAAVPSDPATLSAAELDALFGGTAASTDNCRNVVTQTISGEVNNCGIGQFIRTFTLTDTVGGQVSAPGCSQVINVLPLHDYTIIFPADSAATCREEPIYDAPVVIENACDLLAIDLEVDTFQAQADECYKLRITYELINWCEFTGNAEPYRIPRDLDGDNNVNELTYLDIRPNDGGTGDDEAFLLNNVAWNSLGSEDEVEGAVSRLLDSDGVPYGQDAARGYFEYIQYIRVYDNDAPVITAETPAECFAALNANCTGTVSLPVTLADACTSADQLRLSVELDQDYAVTDGFRRNRFLIEAEITSDGNGNFTVTLDNVPTGEHALRLRADDRCGNVNNVIVPICVTDQKAPTPICHPQLTVTLTPQGNGTGMAAIWANDYIASEVFDCSGEVSYSIYQETEFTAGDFTPEPARDGILLDCESDQTTRVRVYAFDEEGRNDFCSVFVLVQRADNACDPNSSASLAGVVYTELGDLVTGVNIALTSPDGLEETVTGVDGRYSFEDLRIGLDYTVVPSLDSYRSHAQGVSTLDLVILIRHILGVRTITSDYELLAGDANNDQEISIQDIIAIRRLILGLDDGYRDNEPYRFVASNFVFPVSGNPWATRFPEVVNRNNLSRSSFDADFIGLMVGDVSGDGFENLIGKRETETKGRAGALFLETEDRELLPGETYAIALTAGAGASAVAGWQGTIQVGAGVHVEAIQAGLIGKNELNATRAKIDGTIAFSHARSTGETTQRPLLTLVLTTETPVLLSDVLSLSNRLVATEAYLNDVAKPLFLSFTPGTESASGLSLTNYPNPVVDHTTVRFQLPAAETVRLTLTDAAGRILVQRAVDAAAGWNGLRLERDEMSASGLVTYSLQTSRGVTSRKMLLP